MKSFLRVLWGLLLVSACWSCGPERTVKSQNEDLQGPSQGEESFHARYQLKLDWQSGPYVGVSRENQVRLTFFNSAGEPVGARDLSFKIWMKVHGHGGKDRQQEIKALDPHGYVFEVSKFYFIMAGWWEIQLRFKLAGESYELEIPIEVT